MKLLTLSLVLMLASFSSSSFASFDEAGPSKELSSIFEVEKINLYLTFDSKSDFEYFIFSLDTPKEPTEKLTLKKLTSIMLDEFVIQETFRHEMKKKFLDKFVRHIHLSKYNLYSSDKSIV